MTTRRRFTPEEDEIITQAYLEYLPTLAIAGKVQRTHQSIRQRVQQLGLHRSKYATMLLAWAPEHLRPVLKEQGEAEFIKQCYAWRNGEEAKAAASGEDYTAQADTRMRAQCALIDADPGMPRNAKVVAKRLIGMTLAAIGQQHSITRERVRQLTDPDYIAYHRAKIRPRGLPHAQGRLAKMNALRAKSEAHQAIVATMVEQQVVVMVAMWEAMDEEAQVRFKEHINGDL